jgi:hypothetical protein
MKTLTPRTNRMQMITLSLGRRPLQAAFRSLAAILRRCLALFLFFLFAALVAQPCAATPFQWEYTGSLANSRKAHTATLLLDGRVLVSGGAGSGLLASAELYDPVSGNWTLTGSLNGGRTAHTATLLSDGKILVVGGVGDGKVLGSAELYEPATGTWTPTGSLNTARISHTATLLADGRVLVVGGFTATAELYDPATGTWTYTSSPNTPRSFHTATLLADGRVLVAGGEGGGFFELASAELYDPATGAWAFTGSLTTARKYHTATLLLDDKVLAAGGEFAPISEVYDPASGTWSAAGSLANGIAMNHTATLLPDGKVLVAGGGAEFSDTDFAQLYDPATGTWTATGSLNTGRYQHTATLLSDGNVLVAGGFNGKYLWLASAELYEPGVAATKAKGRGTVENQESEVRFGFHATTQSDDYSTLGHFSFCDPAAGVCLTNVRINTFTITGNSAELSGPARLEDGTRVKLDVSVSDNGSPGTSDTISISLSNGYTAAGNLTSGEIKIY